MKAFVLAALVLIASANTNIKKLQAQMENQEYCDPLASALTVKQSEAAEFCSFYPYEVCSATESICVHKGVFPVLTSEIVGLVILPVMLGLASVAGLGGGVVFVPIMMAFFHFKTKQVVAMSLAIVFQSGLIRTFGFSFWASHPDKKDSTEIDWNTVKVAYPLFLVGSYLGVLTSMILPDILLCVFLTIILVYLCYTSFVKGRSLWQKESRALLDRVEQPFSDQKELATWDMLSGQFGSELMSKINAIPAEEEELYQILEREKLSVNQWYTNLEMLGLTLLTVVVNFVRGTKSFGSIIGIDQCSVAGWGVFVVFCLICLLVSYKNTKQLLHEQSLKKKYGKGLCKSDLLLEGWTTFKLLSGALFGSWIGVTFGLGGGIVFNPIQIEMGVNPIVASSSSMYMIMLATFSSTVMYIYNGQFDYAWVGWFMIWCGIGVLIGMIWIQGAIKRSGRVSLVVLSLALVLLIATILGAGGNILDLHASAQAGVDIWAWSSLC